MDTFVWPFGYKFVEKKHDAGIAWVLLGGKRRDKTKCKQFDKGDDFSISIKLDYLYIDSHDFLEKLCTRHLKWWKTTRRDEK